MCGKIPPSNPPAPPPPPQKKKNKNKNKQTNSTESLESFLDHDFSSLHLSLGIDFTSKGNYYRMFLSVWFSSHQ